MATDIRVALVGGSEAVRSARRAILATAEHLKVVFDSDGFGFTPAELVEINFDVAVIELRLEGQSALDYIKSMFVSAKIQKQSFGRLLVAAQYSDENLRLESIQAGAVDAVFVSDGMQSLISKIEQAADEYSDFAIRELLSTLPEPTISQSDYQQVSVALDTLDEKEAKILRGFCELKTDSQISSAVHVPKLKVRQCIAKVQNLLKLDTRSQLLLKLYSLGALAL